MKIQITFKDPDALIDCIADGVRENFDKGALTDEEAEAVIEKREKIAHSVASKWFKYGEYLTVEIDTDTGTCVVIPAID
jgi:hypothetical protein